MLLALSACSSCVDQPAQPVELRVVNKLAWPIYVADELEQLGLTVQHDEGAGAWTAMSELASCDCQECHIACDPCECPQGLAWVRRIGPGAHADRT